MCHHRYIGIRWGRAKGRLNLRFGVKNHTFGGNMTKIFRQGGKGAMLDVYEQAIAELKEVIAGISDNSLTVIVDPDTRDENCRSFQSILSHVVHGGFGYATSIHNLKDLNKQRPDKSFHVTVKKYMDDLDRMFAYTETVLKEFTEIECEELDNALKIKTGWGQTYDIEQLMEHAIVHILRHKRQIERFRIKVFN